MHKKVKSTEEIDGLIKQKEDQIENFKENLKSKEQKIKEHEKLESDFSQIKKEFIVEIRKQSEEVEGLQKKLKEKEKQDKEEQDYVIEILQKKLKEEIQKSNELNSAVKECTDALENLV